MNIIFEERLFWDVPLIVPITMEDEFLLVEKSFEECSHYCGAGVGIGDLIVPETVLGLRTSIACKIHDLSWDIAEPTWSAFRKTNLAFRENLNNIIKFKSKYKFIEHLRYYRAVTYFNAVDTIGQDIFWSLKEDQIRAEGDCDHLNNIRKLRRCNG